MIHWIVERTCITCGETKPLKDFPVMMAKNTLKSGEKHTFKGRRKVCRKCFHKGQAYRKKLREFKVILHQ